MAKPISFQQSFHTESFQAGKLDPEVSTPGNILEPGKLPNNDVSFHEDTRKLYDEKQGNFYKSNQCVSTKVSGDTFCSRCGALVNPWWDECASCHASLVAEEVHHHCPDIPKTWIAGVSTLRDMVPPEGRIAASWPAICKDARHLIDVWAAQAYRLGWDELDLFGCHPTAPHARYDCAGLAPLLGRNEVSALTKDTAVIRHLNGKLLTFYKHSMNKEQSVPVWTLQPKPTSLERKEQ